MTTDREYLELAAKAAGYDVQWRTWVADPKSIKGECFSFAGTYDYWNPLTDDGDAFRLAVKLMMKLEMDESARNVYVDAEGSSWGGWIREPLDADPLAATRRAIVRAAAEIGKGMK